MEQFKPFNVREIAQQSKEKFMLK